MRYEITALKAGQDVVRLAVDAHDESSARAHARASGLTVIAARQAPARLPGIARLLRPRFSLRLFSQELLALLQAGLSLQESLETLAQKETVSDHRLMLGRLRDALYDGRTFSAALEQSPSHFPALYVATVRAAERTGDLPSALARYVHYQARVDTVKAKVISASIYPALLLLIGGLVTLFLLGYVVPRFSAIYTDVERDLPWLSRVLLSWGALLNDHAGAIVLVMLGALGAFIALLPAVRRALSLVLMRVPALAERVRVYELARLYRTVGMLLVGGTPLPQALTMASGLLGPALADRLARAIQRIREGTAASTALEDTGLTTPVAARMLRVGERSGGMGPMMERIAEFYDEDIGRWVDWFTKLFEPLLMAFIGVVIGAIVVLMYLPIFELAGSLQ